jgi:hypothetical protein
MARQRHSGGLRPIGTLLEEVPDKPDAAPRPVRRRPAAVITHDNVKIGDGIGTPVCRPDIQPATEVACWV